MRGRFRTSLFRTRPLTPALLALVLRPKALFRVGDWAPDAAVTDYYGLTPAQLHDDRLGRALERLAQHAETVETALVLRAIDQFALDVRQIHYDITSVELFGAYDLDLAEGVGAWGERVDAVDD